MKSLIISSIMVLLMPSCDEKECCLPGHDVLFEFSVLNNAGLDLLDQDNVESFNQSNIRIYNSDGNVVFNSNSDAPYGYSIHIGRDSINRIQPYFDINDKLTMVGYIRWNQADLDTIKLSLIQQSSTIKRLTKIFYNNSEVWNEETATNSGIRYFQIVK